jgi:hypothetical protein
MVELEVLGESVVNSGDFDRRERREQMGLMVVVGGI